MHTLTFFQLIVSIGNGKKGSLEFKILWKNISGDLRLIDSFERSCFRVQWLEMCPLMKSFQATRTRTCASYAWRGNWTARSSTAVTWLPVSIAPRKLKIVPFVGKLSSAGCGSSRRETCFFGWRSRLFEKRFCDRSFFQSGFEFLPLLPCFIVTHPHPQFSSRNINLTAERRQSIPPAQIWKDLLIHISIASTVAI